MFSDRCWKCGYLLTAGSCDNLCPAEPGYVVSLYKRAVEIGGTSVISSLMIVSKENMIEQTYEKMLNQRGWVHFCTYEISREVANQFIFEGKTADQIQTL